MPVELIEGVVVAVEFVSPDGAGQMVIFYPFGAATVFMFQLYDLTNLSLISGVIWAMVVVISIGTTGRRFFQQSIARDWTEKA